MPERGFRRVRLIAALTLAGVTGQTVTVPVGEECPTTGTTDTTPPPTTTTDEAPPPTTTTVDETPVPTATTTAPATTDEAAPPPNDQPDASPAKPTVSGPAETQTSV